MKAKIGDFGGATIGEDTALRDLTSRRHGGHVGYRSPEFIQDTSSRRLPPNDVFSYGSVCYFVSLLHDLIPDAQNSRELALHG
jgi:serine/threonine protein kinase